MGQGAANGADARRDVRVKDDHLQEVLEGRAFLILDGAMGTMLQSKGLQGGDLPDLLCVSEPDGVTSVHREYVGAGSQAVTTNTFGANTFKLGDSTPVDEVYEAAISCARASGARYVAADVGPTGQLMSPMGTLTPESAYEAFSQQARAAEEHGADLVIIETMADLQEAKAAVQAAADNTHLPIFATMTFTETGRTFMGVAPEQAACALHEAGASAVGVNCSLGPDALAPIVEKMLDAVSCPIIVQANAGLPQLVKGQTVYVVEPEEYVAALRPMLDAGVSIIGGCCGTDPRYIALIAQELAERGLPSSR